MSDLTQRRAKGEFFGEKPLGADDPIDGVEKFTILEVGNPILVNGQVNGELAKALFLSMHKKIKRRISGHRRTETKYSKVVYEPRMAAKINSVGTVEMQVVNAARFEVVDRVSDVLVDELFRSCGKNETVVLEVFDLFWARVARQEYKAPELMSTLLVCIEEKKLAQEMPQIIENKPRQYPMLDFKIARRNVDEKYEGQGDISIRVVSIREMLKSYFEKHPKRYHEAIAKVAGFESLEGLNARDVVEEQISRIGVWEFAVKIWMQVREWDSQHLLGDGIIEPIDSEEQWILCPRWSRKKQKMDVSTLAKIIYEHYTKTI